MRRNLRNKRNRKIIIPHQNLILVLTTLVCICLPFIIHHVFFRSSLKTVTAPISENEVVSFTSNNLENTTETSFSQENENVSTTFTLTALGDIMCHNTQYLDAYQKETEEYDFSYVFEDIHYYTKTSDITIANLETTFAGAERGYRNYPTFNSPDSLAYSLKKIGVDVISTAGNHSLDMGYSGLCRTLDVLDKADISHLGTYRTAEEQEKLLIKYVKGVKIAFLNYTYGTNGISIPSGKEYCVNLIDQNLIKKQIELAKSQNVDIIVACMHWGTEYQTSANKEQKQLADYLFQNGVDIILGNHPHVLQPMEKRTITLTDGSTKDGFVVYALGNFIADQNAENTRNSVILNLTITKNESGKISIDRVNYIPIYMDKDTSKNRQKFKLLDLEKTIKDYEEGINTTIPENSYQNLKMQLDKIKKILGEKIIS